MFIIGLLICQWLFKCCTPQTLQNWIYSLRVSYILRVLNEHVTLFIFIKTGVHYEAPRDVSQNASYLSISAVPPKYPLSSSRCWEMFNVNCSHNAKSLCHCRVKNIICVDQYKWSSHLSCQKLTCPVLPPNLLHRL